MSNKEFFSKNLNGFHLGSIIIFVVFAVIYWWKSGQFSAYFYKNNLAIVIVWGILVGWIIGDYISHARHK